MIKSHPLTICAYFAYTLIFGPNLAFSAEIAAPTQTAAAPTQTTTDIVATIPIKYRNNLMFVEAMINHKGPYTFIVDTGATKTVLFEHVSRQLEITENSVRTSYLHGLLETEERPVLEPVTISLGTYDALRIDTVSVPSWDSDRRPDGILGNDILKQHVVVVDREQETMTLTTTKGLARLKNRTWSTVRIIDNPFSETQFDLIFVKSTINGYRIPALFDTGSQISIMNPAGITKLAGGIKLGRSPTSSRIYRDILSEAYLNKFVRVLNYRIGRRKWKKTIFLIADMTPLKVLGLEDDPLIIAGANLVNDRSFAIDYANNKLFISAPLDLGEIDPNQQFALIP